MLNISMLYPVQIIDASLKLYIISSVLHKAINKLQEYILMKPVLNVLFMYLPVDIDYFATKF